MRLAFCILVLAGLAAGPARLDVQSPIPAPAPTPSFAELLEQYRRGDAAAAIAAFARWTPVRIEAEALMPAGRHDAKVLAALALFHTEAGIAAGTFGRFASRMSPLTPSRGRGFTALFDVHSRAAFRYIHALEPDATPWRAWFVQQWHELALLHCMRGRLVGCRDEILSRVGRDLDEDPTVLVLIGAGAEPRRVARPGDKRKQIPNFYAGAGQESRWAFTRALRIDPTLVEARLRLGRVYWVTNERRRAERELTQALAEARAAGLRVETHLAALFLGELYEEQRRMDEAIDHFRMAVSLFPDAHSASLALGQALVRTGRTDEGWAIGRTMFGKEGPTTGPAPDPYVNYSQPILSQQTTRIAALRAAIRN
jgi:tetratricopeptide (TPR) repeat protein